MIIVTGGAGFIGSNLVKGLNDQGENDILIVDNLEQSVKHLNLNSLTFIDFMDKHTLPEKLNTLSNVKAIFHQGACSDTTESNGTYMMKNNYEYSKLLLHYAIDRKIPFLYASSASVYGDGRNGFRESPECEDPLNIYAFSKFAFDNYVRRYLSKAESQITGLRYFNVYGYQENHKDKMASVAFHLYHQLEESGEMRLFEGSHEFFRDFVFVEDVIDVNLFCYENRISGIYNCGTGHAESFVSIAETYINLNDGKGIVKFIPLPDDLKGKYQTFTRANMDAIKNEGYTKSFCTLENGLRKYISVLRGTEGFIK